MRSETRFMLALGCLALSGCAWPSALPDCFEAREEMMARLGAMVMRAASPLRVGDVIPVTVLGEPDVKFTVIEGVSEDRIQYRMEGSDRISEIKVDGFVAESFDEAVGWRCSAVLQPDGQRIEYRSQMSSDGEFFVSGTYYNDPLPPKRF